MEGVLVRTVIAGIGFLLAVVLIYIGLWPLGVAVAAIAVVLYAAWYRQQAKRWRAMKKAHREH